MDVDEDEEGTQRPKRVQDYGIEVDFDNVDEDEREVFVDLSFPPMTSANGLHLLQADPAEAIAELDASISKLAADIEKMAPNMKAIDRFVACMRPDFAVYVLTDIPGLTTSKQSFWRRREKQTKPARTPRARVTSSMRSRRNGGSQNRLA